jgi:hypothetical protein
LPAAPGGCGYRASPRPTSVAPPSRRDAPAVQVTGRRSRSSTSTSGALGAAALAPCSRVMLRRSAAPRLGAIWVSRSSSWSAKRRSPTSWFDVTGDPAGKAPASGSREFYPPRSSLQVGLTVVCVAGPTVSALIAGMTLLAAGRGERCRISFNAGILVYATSFGARRPVHAPACSKATQASPTTGLARAPLAGGGPGS